MIFRNIGFQHKSTFQMALSSPKNVSHGVKARDCALSLMLTWYSGMVCCPQTPTVFKVQKTFNLTHCTTRVCHPCHPGANCTGALWEAITMFWSISYWLWLQGEGEGWFMFFCRSDKLCEAPVHITDITYPHFNFFHYKCKKKFFLSESPFSQCSSTMPLPQKPEDLTIWMQFWILLQFGSKCGYCCFPIWIWT